MTSETAAPAANRASLWRRATRPIATTLRYARLSAHDRRFGRQLRCVQDHTAQIKRGDILLFCCLRNEAYRLRFFTDYYRSLGVSHFLFVDNGSTDHFSAWAAEQSDVSVWRTEASYKASRFGMLWCNDLLRRYGVDHWCVTCDPDEFLVFPRMESRSLKALTQHLDDEARPCLHALLVDAYSDRPLRETVLEDGANPFDACPYFDRDGYVMARGVNGGLWIRGGPRLRVHAKWRPVEAAAVNKIPLVKWRRHYHYQHSTHDALPFLLNKAHAPHGPSVTSVLFHFKFVSRLEEKAREERMRNEHYADGREYAAYLERLDENFHEPGLSVRYEGSEQLVRLGLMSPGQWL